MRAQATTNGIESFWAMLKRGQDGVYHHFSVKHLDRAMLESSRAVTTAARLTLRSKWVEWRQEQWGSG